MTAGQRLRGRLQTDLDAAGVDLTGTELELADRAEAIANSIEQLEAVIALEGPTTQGRRGTITHPALTEVRHLSALLARILGQLKVPDDEEPAKAHKGPGRGGTRAS
jgi:hypothetical protein